MKSKKCLTLIGARERKEQLTELTNTLRLFQKKTFTIMRMVVKVSVMVKVGKVKVGN